jgi:hypothetical protein
MVGRVISATMGVSARLVRAAFNPQAVIGQARIPQCSTPGELLSFRLVRRALSRCSLAYQLQLAHDTYGLDWSDPSIGGKR